MNLVLSRGFVVQGTIMPLDLSESRNYAPTLFITGEKQYVKALRKDRYLIYKNLEEYLHVFYWEYNDEDQQNFEENLFKMYESIFLERTDVSSIYKYLKLCRTMCRCGDLDEAKRIFLQLYAIFDNCDIYLVVELLETVCLIPEMVLFVFNTAAVNNLHFLKCLLLWSKAQNINFCTISESLWRYSWDIISEYNLISHFFNSEYYLSIPTLLKHGLQWTFSESVYEEYCKAINSTWTLDTSNCDYEESAGKSKHRFFLILQIYLTIRKPSEDTHKMRAVHMLWRSIPDAVISKGEMITSLKKFCVLDEESLEIPNTAVWWEADHVPGLRSLKHLSRCTVRQRLSKNYKLPDGVLKLDIPQCLKHYINLEE